MNNRTIIFFCFAIVLGASSCSVTQRHYLPGYSISWKNKQYDSKANAPIVSSTNKNDSPNISLQENTAESYPLTGSTEGAVGIIPAKTKNIKINATLETCDSLFLKSGAHVTAKIIEINPKEVKYKKCDNPDGPVIIIRKADVATIKYSNGTSEDFNETGKSKQSEHESDYYNPKDNTKKPYNSAPKNLNTSDTKINPFALTSMILAIAFSFVFPILLFVSPFFIFLVPIPLILGIIGLQAINQQPDLYTGKAMAIFGIVYNGLTFLALALLALLIIALL